MIYYLVREGGRERKKESSAEGKAFLKISVFCIY